ncbi:hypothetical protein VULLAG_LOCUS14389 [Vulpes lagopus]
MVVLPVSEVTRVHCFRRPFREKALISWLKACIPRAPCARPRPAAGEPGRNRKRPGRSAECACACAGGVAVAVRRRLIGRRRAPGVATSGARPCPAPRAGPAARLLSAAAGSGSVFFFFVRFSLLVREGRRGAGRGSAGALRGGDAGLGAGPRGTPRPKAEPPPRRRGPGAPRSASVTPAGAPGGHCGRSRPASLRTPRKGHGGRRGTGPGRPGSSAETPAGHPVLGAPTWARVRPSAEPPPPAEHTPGRGDPSPPSSEPPRGAPPESPPPPRGAPPPAPRSGAFAARTLRVDWRGKAAEVTPLFSVRLRRARVSPPAPTLTSRSRSRSLLAAHARSSSLPYAAAGALGTRGLGCGTRSCLRRDGAFCKRNHEIGAAGGAGVSAAVGPGRDPGDPGSSPASGSLRGACFSLCLGLCLSLSLSLSLIYE